MRTINLPFYMLTVKLIKCYLLNQPSYVIRSDTVFLVQSRNVTYWPAFPIIIPISDETMRLEGKKQLLQLFL